MKPEAKKLITKAKKQFMKDYGQGSLTTLDSPENWSKVTDWLSTQSLALDFAIGRPGLPAGRITEIVGQPQTGKTLLGIHLLKETQRRGGIAVLDDPETAYDLEWAAKLGLNIPDLVLLQSETLEDIFERQEKFIRLIREDNNNILVTMVADSIASIQTRAEKETADKRMKQQKETDKKEKKRSNPPMATHARVISLYMRRILRMIGQERIVMVYINQQKEKIGTFFQTQYRTLGGAAVEFSASLRLEIRYKGRLVAKTSKIPYGISTRTSVIKNRLAPPFRQADVDILFNSGIDIGHSALPVAVATGVVVPKGGGWFELGGEKLQLGELKERLAEPKMIEKIREKAGLRWRGK